MSRRKKDSAVTLDLPDGASLGEARAAVDSHKRTGGSYCPCCTRRVQEYRWHLIPSAARSLVALCRLYERAMGEAHPGEGEGWDGPWHHSREWDVNRGGHGTRLRWLGLAVEQPERREDGGKSGFWQPTAYGLRVVRGLATTPEVWVYRGEVTEVLTNVQHTIQESLDSPDFHYDTMMNPTPDTGGSQ